MERGGQCEYDGTLGLQLDGERIDHVAHVDRGDDPVHAHPSVALDRGLDHLRANAALRIMQGNAAK